MARLDGSRSRCTDRVVRARSHLNRSYLYILLLHKANNNNHF